MSQESPLTETSTVVALWRRLLVAVSAVDETWVGRRVQSISTVLGTAASASGLAGFARMLGRWSRASFLWRWLTAEPDPDVIVIDLRESYTLRPILVVFDRISGTFARAWGTAGLKPLVRTTEAHLQRHPIRTLSIAALAALLTELTLSLVLASLSPTGVGTRLALIGLSLLGTRIRVSWQQCTELATYESLVAILEPPEIPDEDEPDTTDSRRR